jgi:hypothetical protein
MTETPIERIDRPTLAPPGEPCPACGTPLARDQRYCLTCGARRPGLAAMLSAEPQPRAGSARRAPATVEPVPEAAPPARTDAPWRLDAGLVAGVGCLLLALLVGVLIGRSGSSEPTAATPQVVTVGPTATATPAGTPVSFTSDWPAGKRGFTVQLQALPKTGTDAAAVAAAKQAATAKGATGVGALDSDQYSSLGGGSYVVYSGQYADRKAAAAALKDVKSSFPGAKVVEVSDTASTADTGASKQPSKAEQAAGAQAINDLNNTSGEDYSKKSAKLPKDLVTPGKAPPKDNKPAGGGSQTETFP